MYIPPTRRHPPYEILRRWPKLCGGLFLLPLLTVFVQMLRHGPRWIYLLPLFWAFLAVLFLVEAIETLTSPRPRQLSTFFAALFFALMLVGATVFPFLVTLQIPPQ